jgi:protein-disulfide isomerase
MLEYFFRAVVLSALLFGPAPTLARADAFTAQQRAEIVAVVRAALRADPSILRDAITALQQDDAAQQEATAHAAVAGLQDALTRTPGDPVEGNPEGNVTVVEFSDLRCPFCRRMLPVIAELLRHNGDLRLIHKDIPILGPGSVLSAKAVLAAQRQDGYLKLRQAVMTGPANVTVDSLRAAATKAGLDWDRLEKDMADPAVQSRIDANLALAGRLHVQGTPAFVIGERVLGGAIELGELEDAVAAARKTE